MTKNILVTGSSGFLGEEVVNYFSKENNIYALDKIKSIDFKESTNNIFKLVCDICDYDKLNNIFENNKFDIIIHCAAEILDEKNTNLVWKTNVDGTNSADIDVEFVDSDGSTKALLASTLPVPADSSLEVVSGKFVLETGDKIQAKASAASDIEMFVSMLEIT